MIRPLSCGGGRQINSSWFGLPKRGKRHQRFYSPRHCRYLIKIYQHLNISAFIQSSQKFASRLEVYSMCIVLPTLFLPRRRVLSVILCITALRRKDPLSPQAHTHAKCHHLGSFIRDKTQLISFMIFFNAKLEGHFYQCLHVPWLHFKPSCFVSLKLGMNGL